MPPGLGGGVGDIRMPFSKSCCGDALEEGRKGWDQGQERGGELYEGI